MKKYLLIAVIAITTLFAATAERIEVVPLTEGDIGTVRGLTGYSLRGIEEDDCYREENHSKYKFDGGNVIVHTYRGKLYEKAAEFAEALTVTMRFFAVSTGRVDEIFGLDVFEKSTDQTYDLIVSRKNRGEWSVLAPAKSEPAVTAFCDAVFKAVPTFK